MTGVLVGEMQRERHREEGQVRIQAETGAMLPEVQGHAEPPYAEEAEPTVTSISGFWPLQLGEN